MANDKTQPVDDLATASWERWASPRRRGFSLMPLYGANGRRRLVHCEACERPLAHVQNGIAEGLVAVHVLCVCGVETGLVATETSS